MAITILRKDLAKEPIERVANIQELKDIRTADTPKGGPTPVDIAIMQAKTCGDIAAIEQKGAIMCIRFRDDPDTVLELSNRGSTNGELRAEVLIEILQDPGNQGLSLLNAIDNYQLAHHNLIKYASGGFRNTFLAHQAIDERVVVPKLQEISDFIYMLATASTTAKDAKLIESTNALRAGKRQLARLDAGIRELEGSLAPLLALAPRVIQTRLRELTTVLTAATMTPADIERRAIELSEYIRDLECGRSSHKIVRGSVGAGVGLTTAIGGACLLGLAGLSAPVALPLVLIGGGFTAFFASRKPADAVASMMATRAESSARAKNEARFVQHQAALDEYIGLTILCPKLRDLKAQRDTAMMDILLDYARTKEEAIPADPAVTVSVIPSLHYAVSTMPLVFPSHLPLVQPPRHTDSVLTRLYQTEMAKERSRRFAEEHAVAHPHGEADGYGPFAVVVKP